MDDYRKAKRYRRIMKSIPRTWRGWIRMSFRELRYSSDSFHDIPALRRPYLRQIRDTIYWVFYDCCRPLLPADQVMQLLRRYCRLTEEEYYMLCDEYENTYHPPINLLACGPRSLRDQVCKAIRDQCESDANRMSQLPLGPEELYLLLWNPVVV